MPLYRFACPQCGYEVEKIAKYGEKVYCEKCEGTFKEVGGIEMELLLSTPAAPQWKCSTAHSRSKGF